MKPRNTIFSLLLILLIIAIAILKWRVYEPHKREAFDRHPSHIEYTKHALCRMDCRHIDAEDIKEIMQKGIIIFNRTNMNDRPCPTFAIQGYTTQHENLRVIFAQCAETTKVITCYNLKQDFECHCPGDEKKNTY